jgi:HEAT repeat protein
MGVAPTRPERERVGTELLALLDHEEVRHSAADGIKKGWLVKSQIPQLIEVISRMDDRGLRKDLGVGIGRVPDLDRSTMEILATAFLPTPGAAFEIFRTIGPPAEPVLHQFVTDDRVEVRRTVCELLGNIGSEASIPILEQLEKNPDRGVAAKAEQAIKEIRRPPIQRPYLRSQ